jgi:hypothetical protein
MRNFSQDSWAISQALNPELPNNYIISINTNIGILIRAARINKETAAESDEMAKLS